MGMRQDVMRCHIDDVKLPLQLGVGTGIGISDEVIG